MTMVALIAATSLMLRATVALSTAQLFQSTVTESSGGKLCSGSSSTIITGVIQPCTPVAPFTCVDVTAITTGFTIVAWQDSDCISFPELFSGDGPNPETGNGVYVAYEVLPNSALEKRGLHTNATGASITRRSTIAKRDLISLLDGQNIIADGLQAAITFVEIDTGFNLLSIGATNEIAPIVVDTIVDTIFDSGTAAGNTQIAGGFLLGWAWSVNNGGTQRLAALGMQQVLNAMNQAGQYAATIQFTDSIGGLVLTISAVLQGEL